jgi:hypothetical protein
MAEKIQTAEIDWAKITKLQNAAIEYTEENLKKALVFDPKDVACKAKMIREVYDEDLGTIRFAMLSYSDLQEIVAKHADNQERSVQILFRQLAPASKGLTVDDVRSMPYEVVVRLLVKLQGEGSFFYRKPQATPQTSKNGST